MNFINRGFFLGHLVEITTKNNALLDLVAIYNVELITTVEVTKSFGASDHIVINFNINSLKQSLHLGTIRSVIGIARG